MEDLKLKFDIILFMEIQDNFDSILFPKEEKNNTPIIETQEKKSFEKRKSAPKPRKFVFDSQEDCPQCEIGSPCSRHKREL